MIIGMFFYSTLVTFLELFAPPEGDDGIPNAFIGQYCVVSIVRWSNGLIDSVLGPETWVPGSIG